MIPGHSFFYTDNMTFVFRSAIKSFNIMDLCVLSPDRKCFGGAHHVSQASLRAAPVCTGHTRAPPRTPALTRHRIGTDTGENKGRLMIEFAEANPRKRSSALDPLNDPVETVDRPLDYRDLLSDPDFADSPWNTSFASERYFYLTGVADAMRLLQENSASFLKLRGYLDDLAQDPDLERWSMQSGVALDQPIKRERAAEIAVLRPTYFYKCVECLVAFEQAFRGSIKLKDRVSPYWVYDYMRVVPAVYNLRGFNRETLQFLRVTYNDFNRRALAAMDQHEDELLDDLADGKTVTRPTALRLKHFIDTECPGGDEHAIGQVRNRPGRRGLGRGPASWLEIVEPEVSPPSDDA